MANVLPVEIKICETVKGILEANHRYYIRKYCTVLRRNGQPTGQRTHKFYCVYRSDSCPDDLSFESVMEQLQTAIKEIDGGYGIEIVYGQFGGTSLRVYPIYRSCWDL